MKKYMISALLLMVCLVGCAAPKEEAKPVVLADVYEALVADEGLALPDTLVDLNEMSLVEQYGIEQTETTQLVAKQTAAYGIGALDTFIFAEMKDEDSAAATKTMLEKQIEGFKKQTEGYDPVGYEVLCGSIVRQDGTLVAMIVSADAKNIDVAYDALIG